MKKGAKSKHDFRNRHRKLLYKDINFISKVSNVSGLLKSDPVNVGGRVKYLGEGQFDTEIRKAYKESYLYLLKTAVQKSTLDKNTNAVVGLPLMQYKEDKQYLINRILQSGILQDVDVLPEGIMTVDADYEGIVIDIGGGTTDICLLQFEGNRRKTLMPYSIPNGILSLESDFVNYINSKFGLDLLPADADRILRSGLYINGEQQYFNLDVYREFIENLISRIRIEYSLKTNKVILVGGGASRLYNSFKKRVPQAEIINNSFFANAVAFEDYGRSIWG
ncbi:ParM/StbA family protein [Clostridiaceae bacterium WCA-383-APC-5B]|uniref:ParM/StbA family protein n=1 Tax=Inconstantimicrobium porci TaxID=2652291 RepID=A0A7X2N100_9CLOT|nr:ParM/StbA family protein [Inconstantimicrobium porci]